LRNFVGQALGFGHFRQAEPARQWRSVDLALKCCLYCGNDLL
jgi:hypothetical protein